MRKSSMGLLIEHKITPSTPDSICIQCSQYYEPEGGCRAFSMPHSDKGRDARTTEFGMECDSEHLKDIYYTRYGVLYRTPKGVYDK